MAWRRGVSLPNFGAYSDPATMVGLAVLAEESGWDGFFIWDHIVVGDGMPVADPWVMLGAIAATTHDLILGPMVTPLPRRRPWVVARQATTVDHLSGGRLVLGVGLGSPPDEELGTFAEPTDPAHRAAMLDEGLGVLTGMWSGDRFALAGDHYTVRPTRFAPRPVAGTIPVWVAATWPRSGPLRRAARFQGVFPMKEDMSGWEADEVAELRAEMRRIGVGPEFEVVVAAEMGAPGIDDLAAAGATWVLSLPGMGAGPDAVRSSIASGPGRGGLARLSAQAKARPIAPA